MARLWNRWAGWRLTLNHLRRPSKSYERLTCMDESWVDLAMTRIMLERLV